MSNDAPSPPALDDDSAAPTVTILVALAGGGTDVWSTTQGRHVRGNLYEILATPDYDAATADWEFPPGAIVECFRSTRADGSLFLVAVREIKP